ncbi:MAG: hypothetical protein E7E15_03525 [Terrisporobacter othiniensis]|uniref:hypothetical protein n=1 Tax=Terrisporobacter othiniensis TaxID=1577792 RepID=UPI002902CFC4|nr:hypothetical protein [Terrisporobacter othiniensis]MDU2200120.1 hypothetical protein [Terrisporobacter othiniensis]
MSKKIIGIIACIVVVLVVAIPVGMNKFGISVDGKSSNKSVQNSNSDENKTSENKENDDKEDKTTDKDVETSSEKNNSDKDSKSDKDNDKNSTSDNSNDSSNKGNNSSDNNSSEKNNTSNGDKVSSNYNTPDASLTIQRINGYSGMFIEDGSDKEVKNVAAIQVKNTSKQVVEYAKIELYNGDKKLVFEVSTLPANSSAVVMEKSKTTFDSSKNVTYGKSTVAYTDKLEKSSDIKYKVLDNNSIEITNKSKKDIGCVRVFYKYKSEEGYYVGGITYVAKVNNLKAGTSETIYPSHFATDGGQVMMVKTYDK